MNTSQLPIDRLGRGGALYGVKRGADWVHVSTAAFVAGVRRAARG
ncbi:hypothetical protein [Paeniglutamicibacter cryotolerans]|nr:hypothetical protein [Paeniglutamicibacter cryotolerans]